MAQTKRKRRSKHRGNAAGTIEARGRTGRKAALPGGAEEGQEGARAPDPRRAPRPAADVEPRDPPRRRRVRPAVRADPDRALPGRRAARPGDRHLPRRDADLHPARLHVRQLDVQAHEPPKTPSRRTDAMDVHGFTVGPVAENCFFAARDGATQAIVVDPGEEGDRLIARARRAGPERRGDPAHPHALRPRRRRRAARAPHRRARLLPRAREARAGGHHELRPVGRASGRSSPTTPTSSSPAASGSSSPGLEIDVLFTPGHSPGHVTYSIPAEQAVFSGDVLFQGSVGRTDLPGGDTATLMRTLARAARRAARRDDRLPRPHGRHDDRRASGPPTRSCARSRTDR